MTDASGGSSNGDLNAPSPTTLARLRRQRREDTGPELALRRALWSMGFRYRVHQPVVPGTRRRVDIAFSRARVAVFVDGCFWHGCPIHGTSPKNNSGWWESKLQANRERDADTNRRLVEAGWRVVRVWEHEDVSDAAARVVAEVLGTS